MKVELQAIIRNGIAAVSVVNSEDGTPVEGLDESFFNVKYVSGPGASVYQGEHTFKVALLEEPVAGVYRCIFQLIPDSIYELPGFSQGPVTLCIAVKGARGHTVFHGQTLVEEGPID